MMEPSAGTQPMLEPPPRRWRWRYLVFAILLIVPVLLVAGWFVLRMMAHSELDRAVAATDQLDHGWRFEDLDAKRATPPEERNAARVIEQVDKLRYLLPEGSKETEHFYDLEERLAIIPSVAQLDAGQYKLLKAYLDKNKDAISEARKLADRPEGRHEVSYPVHYTIVRLPHLESCRATAYLLRFDAMLRAQNGDADGAALDARAILHAGRSIGDEPMVLSQLVRMACQSISVKCFERSLAQGEPSEVELVKMQEALESELAHSPLLTGARGERALMHRMMEAVDKGELKLSVVLGGGSGKGAGATAFDTIGGMSAPSSHAWVLKYLNEMTEIAKLPPEQRELRLKKLEALAKGPNVPWLAKLFLPSLDRMAGSEQRVQAQLRCAVAAVAAERFRRELRRRNEKERWPASVAELVEAKLLMQAFVDPYDGQPLRFRETVEGLVIYTLGPNGKDDHGTIKRNYLEEGDIGFCLYDARRQPPPEILRPPQVEPRTKRGDQKPKE